MRRPISTTLIGILCVGACQRRTQSPDSAVAGGHGAPEAAAVPPRLWVFSGGETGPFCLLLRDDSSGVFFSGFEGNNPVHWRYDSSAHRLDLTLSHLSAADYSVLTDNLSRRYFLALDSVSGTISYSLDPNAPAVNLFNWILRPPTYLEDWQLPSARKGCPPLATPGGG
jgi:hypothetical protein